MLSTAHQEFFGIAVVEAIAAGAHPVLPDRLVYPERVKALGFAADESLYKSIDHAVDLIVAKLGTDPKPEQRAAAMQYDWSVVAPAYDEALMSILDR